MALLVIPWLAVGAYGLFATMELTPVDDALCFTNGTSEKGWCSRCQAMSILERILDIIQMAFPFFPPVSCLELLEKWVAHSKVGAQVHLVKYTF